MLMPFGKYRGEPIDELPGSYVTWLWENVTLREPLKSEIEWRLEAMACDHPRCTPPAPDVVKSIYRELSMKWHPDHGGHTMAQQAINEFYERLVRKREMR